MFTTQLNMQFLCTIILLCLAALCIHATTLSLPVRTPTFEENVLRGFAMASTIEPHQGPIRLVRAWNWHSINPYGPGQSDLNKFTIIELDVYFINSSSQPAYKSILGLSGPYWGIWQQRWVGPLSPIPDHNQSFDFVMDVSVPEIWAVNLIRAAGDRGPWNYVELCVPPGAGGEPHWFFVNLRESITAVGAQTEKVTRDWQPDGVCILKATLTPPE